MKLGRNNWVINSPADGCDINMDDVRIILYATPRSGSTLLYQILCLMFPEGGILLTHQFIPPPPHVWLIMSDRDIMDCIASHFRHRLPELSPITESHVRIVAGWYSQFSVIADHYRDRECHLNCPPCHIHYEVHGGDPARAYTMLHTRCPLGLGGGVTGAALYALGREQQRPIVDAGESTLMQPGHIGSGKSGTYRDMLSDDCVELAKDIL